MFLNDDNLRQKLKYRSLSCQTSDLCPKTFSAIINSVE